MYTNSEINKNSYFYSVSKILCFGVIFSEFYNKRNLKTTMFVFEQKSHLNITNPHKRNLETTIFNA